MKSLVFLFATLSFASLGRADIAAEVAKLSSVVAIQKAEIERLKANQPSIEYGQITCNGQTLAGDPKKGYQPPATPTRECRVAFKSDLTDDDHVSIQQSGAERSIQPNGTEKQYDSQSKWMDLPGRINPNIWLRNEITVSITAESIDAWTANHSRLRAVRKTFH